jgi:murein DD-endopeptidase MepM/ murein hydrolase activator NlpD
VGLAAAVAAAAGAPHAAGYGWPLKPFHRAHPIRGGFGDPRYHLAATGMAVGSFHFGVDIAAPDGTRVYAVEPGYVHAYAASLTVTSRSGREYGYWHVRPVVRTGRWVRLHQLVGYIRRGWGHVHFAERYRGRYLDPLRRGALTPFRDHRAPVVDSVQLLSSSGEAVDPAAVSGDVDVVAEAYDLPPVAPPAPWSGARLAPSAVWWTLTADGAVRESEAVEDFVDGLLPNALYAYVYAPGTYQNKPNRPGRYIFWIAQPLDTTSLPDGTYELHVYASDPRGNVGSAVVQIQTANGVNGVAAPVGQRVGVR